MGRQDAGGRIVNNVQARFMFGANGLIVDHRDDFDYHSEDLNHLSVAGHAWAAGVAWAAMRDTGLVP